MCFFFFYLPDLNHGKNGAVSKVYAHGNKQLKWVFSQFQARKDLGKIWRVERKMGSATFRDQRPKSNPVLQEIPGPSHKAGK